MFDGRIVPKLLDLLFSSGKQFGKSATLNYHKANHDKK